MKKEVMNLKSIMGSCAGRKGKRNIVTISKKKKPKENIYHKNVTLLYFICSVFVQKYFPKLVTIPI